MQMPKAKEMHAVTGEILKLESALAAAKGRYASLLGIAPDAAEKRPRSITSDGFTAKVFSYVESQPNVILQIPAVAEAIDEAELPVGKTLYRLAKAGKIDNPSRGRYRAKGKEAISEETTS